MSEIFVFRVTLTMNDDIYLLANQAVGIAALALHVAHLEQI